MTLVSKPLSDRALEDFRIQAEKLHRFLATVAADIEESNAQLAAHDTQFQRRTAYRTIFASIEALTNYLK